MNIDRTNQFESIVRFIRETFNSNEFIPKESLLCEWCYYWNECEVKSSHNPSIRAW